MLKMTKKDEIDTEYAYWLDNTKYELLNNIDSVLETGNVDKDVLEIMKGLVATIKIKPRVEDEVNA